MEFVLLHILISSAFMKVLIFTMDCNQGYMVVSKFKVTENRPYHYSFAPLIPFCVLYMLNLLPHYLSIANRAGGAGIFELIFQCFV